ncbi:MAG: glutamate-1-semialdehyde 2,1-aminomutase [Bacteroidota bacterium]
MDFTKSIAAFSKAIKVIPGGVNSPVRAFKSVDADPVFIKSAKGSKVYDIDGNEYIDFVASWGPMILGHAHEEVVEAVKKAVVDGASFGAPTIIETRMAELICDMVPSIEKVRMVNSGTEATMSAIRLARGVTGKEIIVKFAGCYHGHADSFLIKAGSGAMTLGLPDSPGVTKETAKNTLRAEFNDIESVKALFDAHGTNIAGVIVEPIAGNMGVVPPSTEFLHDLRDVCDKNNSILIFDEVMTGFRVSAGGAQSLYGVTPDITTLGKIIGGGLPVGAYGGKLEIMSQLAPEGPVYQAGTLSGNLLAMNAGYTTLKILHDIPAIYDELEKKSARLEEGFLKNIRKSGIKATINRVGSMMTLFFNEAGKVTNYTDASKSDTRMYSKYFGKSLEAGVYLAPSQFEAMFISIMHSNEDIEHVIDANKKALTELI